MASRGLSGGIDRVIGHGRDRGVADMDKGVMFAVNCDRGKRILGKSMDV